MIIDLGEGVRLRGGDRAWEIQRQRTRKGEITWETTQWMDTVHGAAQFIAQERVRAWEGDDLRKAASEVAETLADALRDVPQYVITVEERR